MLSILKIDQKCLSLSCTMTNSIDSKFSDPKFNSSREKLYDYIPGTNRLRITIREQQK